ncbi:MAG: hypothetical protein ABSE77_09270 [Acidimicrobiales bacterium]|jgi:uncharacterized protein YegP (UPF0339 family)
MADAPGYFQLEKVAVPGDVGVTWTLYTDTGQIIAKSEKLPTFSDAQKNIEWVKANIVRCDVFLPPHGGPSRPGATAPSPFT